MLLLMFLNPASRRAYRELLPPLLSRTPGRLKIAPQSQFLPPGQRLLSHSLSESCPHLQPSLLLLNFSPFLTVLLESRVAEAGWLLSCVQAMHLDSSKQLSNVSVSTVTIPSIEDTRPMYIISKYDLSGSSVAFD